MEQMDIDYDGDQHVEQMDTHEEAHQSEQDHQRWSHAVVQALSNSRLAAPVRTGRQLPKLVATY